MELTLESARCHRVDSGLLGHDALAALGFAVDCRRRRLVALSDDNQTSYSEEAVHHTTHAVDGCGNPLPLQTADAPSLVYKDGISVLYPY